jgi:signal transduction histidine kinase
MIDLVTYAKIFNEFSKVPLVSLLLKTDMILNGGILMVYLAEFLLYRKSSHSKYLVLIALSFATGHFSTFFIADNSPIQSITLFYLATNISALVFLLSIIAYLNFFLNNNIGWRWIVALVIFDAILVSFLSVSYESIIFKWLHPINVALKLCIHIWIVYLGYLIYKAKNASVTIVLLLVLLGISYSLIISPFVNLFTDYSWQIRFGSYFANSIINAVLLGYFNASIKQQLVVKEATMEALLQQRRQELEEQNTLLEKQVQKRTAELEGILAIKNQIFRIIGHDLRGPIGNLKSTLTIFNEQKINQQELLQYTQNLQKQVEQLYDTIDNILQWSALQMQKDKPMPPSVISIEESVAEVLMQTKYLVEQKNILIISKAKQGRIYMNEHHWQVVLRNLIGNAIKFTPKDGYVMLNSKVNADTVEIVIKDTGIGMSEDKLTKLFSETISSSGTDGEKGTGLGLKICKDLIEAQKGTIQIKSVVGRGTTVKVNLPIYP